jgi:hypothetical protein
MQCDSPAIILCIYAPKNVHIFLRMKFRAFVVLYISFWNQIRSDIRPQLLADECSMPQTFSWGQFVSVASVCAEVHTGNPPVSHEGPEGE